MVLVERIWHRAFALPDAERWSGRAGRKLLEGQAELDGNFWKVVCLDVPEEAEFVILTMGDFVDYFKPVEGVDYPNKFWSPCAHICPLLLYLTGATYCDMFTSNDKHLWTYDARLVGSWVKPDVYVPMTNTTAHRERFGGSALDW